MNNEHAIINDFDFTLIADFFKKLDRQGPGSREVTLQALDFIAGLPHRPRVADIGCGTGGQTAVLASRLDGTIEAVDLLPELVEGLKERIRRENLQEKIRPVLASMDALPFKESDFDLLWAEGSIYNIGYEKGLKEWRKYLKPGGYIAITECSWLGGERPGELGYFQANFPEIDDISEKIRIMQAAGYRPVAHFALPETCWRDHYYAPMENRIRDFLQENRNSAAAQTFAGFMRDDIATYERYKKYFGYVFYIGRKTE